MKKTLKQFIREAASKPEKVSIFVGRFQPFHLGHAKIVKMMKYKPLILLVKGAGTSEDKNKNPLSAEYQEKLIKKVYPNVEVRIVKNAFLNPIVYHIQKSGEQVVAELLAGPDRIDHYRKRLEKEYPEIEYTKTPRFTSATDVRNAIKNGDEEEFKKLMPPKLYSEWDHLRKLIQ